MQPWDVVLLLCPLVTPTPTLLWLGLLLPLSTCHSLTHSTPPGLAVLRSHQALEASTHYFSLVCFFPSPLPLVHSLTLSQEVSSTIHGLLVVCMGHLGVHRMWVLKCTHHDTHSAVLVLGVLLPYLCFFLWWYVFLFIFCFGGFGGRKSWPGSQPLSCLLVSFHILNCLVTGVVFWLGWM